MLAFFLIICPWVVSSTACNFFAPSTLLASSCYLTAQAAFAGQFSLQGVAGVEINCNGFGIKVIGGPTYITDVAFTNCDTAIVSDGDVHLNRFV